MENEAENRKCALKIYNLIYDLSDDGHTNNAITNGMLFALSLHVINSSFSINEIIEQLKKLFGTIKGEIGKIEDGDQVELSDLKPVNSQWD